jgi:hypothetical protein
MTMSMCARYRREPCIGMEQTTQVVDCPWGDAGFFVR